jgi:hypothetical protein
VPGSTVNVKTKVTFGVIIAELFYSGDKNNNTGDGIILNKEWGQRVNVII